jgi:hypothetical protein
MREGKMLRTELQNLFTKYRTEDRQQAIQLAAEALNYVANELILASPGVPPETQILNSKGTYRLTIQKVD